MTGGADHLFPVQRELTGNGFDRYKVRRVGAFDIVGMTGQAKVVGFPG